MLFIVAHHYVWNGGGWKFSTGIVQMESGFFVAGGSLGINLFMLISGYFLGGGSTEYKTKRFISILTDVWSYSWIIAAIFMAFGLGTYNMDDILASVFPVSRSAYWFITAYIGVMLFVPFLNRFVMKISKKNFKILLLVTAFIMSVLPTFIPYGDPWTSEFTWLLFLYLVGAYIKLHGFNIFKNKSFYLWIFLGVYFLVGAANDVFAQIFNGHDALFDYASYFTRRNVLPLLVCSIALFLYFVNLEIKPNKVVNYFGKMTLGVYLLHSNLWIKKILYDKVLFSDKVLDSGGLFSIALIGSTIFIFIAGILIESIRSKGMEKILLNRKFVGRFCEWMDNKLKLQEEK